MPIPDIRDATYKGFRPGMVNRSYGDRASDIYNVKDFGANGFNISTNDDGAKIQLAVNAALSTTDDLGHPKTPGGIIFFPSGTYVIQTPIVVPGTSDAGLVFMGSGSNQVDTGGTKLYSTTLNTDYLLRIGHSSDNDPHRPVSLIMGIGFANLAMPVGGAKINFTTTEPTGAPGGGFGCLYNGSAAPIFGIYNCSIVATNCIGVFSAAPLTSMRSTYTTCGFLQGQSGGASDPPLSSFGVIGRSLRVMDCRVHTCAVALNVFHGQIVVEQMNLEISGCAAVVGENLISYWEPSDSTVDGDGLGGGKVRAPSTNALLNPITHGSLSGMGMESINPSIAFKLTAASNLTVGGITSENFHSTDLGYTVDLGYGMWIGQVTNSKFTGIRFSGKIVRTMAIGQTCTLGFGVTSPGHGGNIIMDSVYAGSTTGTNLWALPPSSWYSSSGADPILFQNCQQEAILGAGLSGQDGGVLFADLPSAPTVTSTHLVVITDANPTDAAWSGSLSRVGKPISSGTGNPATGVRALVRYDKSSSTWRIAG